MNPGMDVTNVPPEDWPWAKESLDALRRAMGQNLVRCEREDGSIPESDSVTNALSRALIVAMRRENGQAWLYQINLYGESRGRREAICEEFTGQMVYNFHCGAVAPVKDEQLIDLIHERDTAEYTGTKADAERLDRIMDRLAAIKGDHLFWG